MANPWTSRGFHLVMTIVWSVALIPTLIWWRESLLWVIFMSLYAIVVSHWGAYQAARGEANILDVLPDAEEA